MQNTLQNKTLKLYQKCISMPDSSLASRCCNFKILEKSAVLIPIHSNL
ncbi:MAG: type III toxin-antitoxin system ToxN/AbiQ family toxin [Lachnospiraceae bacterium]|nr:type III toxin-antitoxin system ToxN/AbiQ family toxin [Roseburia sp. 1XD42-69]MCX4318178.1 type III toxin-antitoxin system ToxN/AbiQ family toxin [Lachnospiraceae bacterium]